MQCCITHSSMILVAMMQMVVMIQQGDSGELILTTVTIVMIAISRFMIKFVYFNTMFMNTVT